MRYPWAWCIPTARISPATPSTPSSTPSSASTWSPSFGKSRTAVNLLLYHGVLAPCARRHSQVVRYGRPAPDGTALEASPHAAVPTRAWTWPALLHRVLALDVLACPRCGGRLRVIATVQDPSPSRPSSSTFAALGPPSRPALPHPPRSQSGRLSPLHPRLDRAPPRRRRITGGPRLRPLERAVSGPPPGLTGEAGRPRRRPPRRCR